MANYKQVLCTLYILLSSSSFAGSMGEPHNPWSTVLSIAAGPTWNSNGQSQTFYLQEEVQKTYSASKKSQTLASGELFLGLQKVLNERYLGQLGLAYAATTQVRQQGDIWEDADPDFNNYYYNYKINPQRLLLKGKLLADFGNIVMPYLSAGAGISFNRAYDFSINPKIYQEIPAPGFQDKSHTSFAYSLGIGFQKALDQHWQVGIGYEFADWGKSMLATAPGQTLNSGLSLNNLYTNSIQISLNLVS